MIFYLPKAVLLTLAVLYFSTLGLKAILCYVGIWLLGAAIMWSLEVSPYGFVAFEAVLAIVLVLHVKKNEIF